MTKVLVLGLPIHIMLLK